MRSARKQEATFPVSNAVLSQRTTMPILTNVKLVARGGLLTATATDLHIAVQRSVPCEGDFAAVVDPKRLAMILKELGDREVEFREEDDAAVLKSAKDRWNLPTMPADDFPDPQPMPAGALELTMQAGAFKQVYKRTVFAADDRPHEKFTFKGVRIEVSQSKLAMAASDGNFFAMCDQNCTTGDMEGVAQCLVPIRALQLFVGNIKSAEEAVAIRFSDKGIELRTDNARVHSALMAGRFPNFRKAIPAKPTAKVKLTLPEFASSIRKASVTADADSRRVDMSFGPGLIEMK